MAKLAFLACAVLLCLAAGGARAAVWTQIDSGMSTFFGGVSCTSTSECWMAGNTLGGKNEVWHTTDAGDNWEGEPINVDSLFMFCVEMRNQTSGVAAGIGLIEIGEGSAYTVDGQKWVQSGGDTSSESQDCCVAGNSFVKVGSWSNKFVAKGDGISFSHDGGKTYSHFDWGVGLPSRYASFASDTVGYVTGGQWPATPSAPERLVSENLKMESTGKVSWVPRAKRAEGSDLNSTWYYGAIAKTTNGGKSFTTQLQVSGADSFYFNGIDCVSETTCYAVGEGVDSTYDPVAYVYRTTDGSTWTRVFTLPQGSLIDVKAVGSSVWAFGGLIPSSGNNPDGLFYKSTDGGNTWAQDGDLFHRAYIMRGEMVDTDHGFAVGVSGFSNLGAVWRYL